MIDWGLATRMVPGAKESGDLHVIRELPQGSMIGAMDGLGHGPEAAVASRLCASLLSDYAGEPLDELMLRCHERLRGTRGVALSLTTLDEREQSWSWLAVGNVSGVLLRESNGQGRSREFLLQRNGVVGVRLPKLAVSSVAAIPGDVLILATDGVRADFSQGLSLEGTPQTIAESILEKHARGVDDALALVARFTGGVK